MCAYVGGVVALFRALARDCELRRGAPSGTADGGGERGGVGDIGEGAAGGEGRSAAGADPEEREGDVMVVFGN